MAVALAILASVDVALCTGLLVWSRAYAERLDHVDPNQFVALLYSSAPADVEARLSEAGRLLQLNPSTHVFCAGGARPERNVFHCREVIERLVEIGIDRSRVAADMVSSDTRSNILAVFAAAGEEEPVFVSDALHLLRVRMLANVVVPNWSYRSSATSQPHGLHLVLRLHWEIAAYVAGALPESLRRALLDLTRT